MPRPPAASDPPPSIASPCEVAAAPVRPPPSADPPRAAPTTGAAKNAAGAITIAAPIVPPVTLVIRAAFRWSNDSHSSLSSSALSHGGPPPQLPREPGQPPRTSPESGRCRSSAHRWSPSCLHRWAQGPRSLAHGEQSRHTLMGSGWAQIAWRDHGRSRAESRISDCMTSVTVRRARSD